MSISLIHSLIIKFVLHWTRKPFPWATVSHQQYTFIMSFKELKKKKTRNSEWQSLWKERLIGGTTGAKPPFKPFNLSQTITDGRRKRPIRSTNIMYLLWKKMLREIIQTTGCMCAMRARAHVCTLTRVFLKNPYKNLQKRKPELNFEDCIT